MDKNTKELRYMEKIKNDIDERLYDLLVMHLINHHEKVRKSGSNKDAFVTLLEKAIANLRKGISGFNKIHFYRYILICCNVILVYDTKRQDIKDLKKELIEDYTASEHDLDDKIPLNYQINEVRLTYDTSYLCYLIKRMIELKQWDKDNIEVDICSIGSKGFGFFNNIGANITGQVAKLGDTPHQEDIFGIIKLMLDAYTEGKIDQLYVMHNKFVNTMTQQPCVERLIPVEEEEIEELKKGQWDYLYEPNAQEVLDTLMTRYIESIVYQGLVENNACEQAARMVAMKSASDNAGKLIDELQLVYNKARQAAITQEISEIVGGAAAV